MPTLFQFLTEFYLPVSDDELAKMNPALSNQDDLTKWPPEEVTKALWQSGALVWSTIRHPDLREVWIDRLGEKRIRVPLAELISKTDDETPGAFYREADLELRPGDLVEIRILSDQGHQPWRGFDPKVNRFMKKALSYTFRTGESLAIPPNIKICESGHLTGSRSTGVSPVSWQGNTMPTGETPEFLESTNSHAWWYKSTNHSVSWHPPHWFETEAGPVAVNQKEHKPFIMDVDDWGVARYGRMTWGLSEKWLQEGVLIDKKVERVLWRQGLGLTETITSPGITADTVVSMERD
jgi:hypothetical protein